MGHHIDKNVLQVWESHRKSSTINGYANNWILWHTYCVEKGNIPLPANAFLFASWLAEKSLTDKTASPTDNRCAAVNYFSKIAGLSSLTTDMVVEITKESIHRRLGYRQIRKDPLTKESVEAVIQYFLRQDDTNFQNLANAFRVTL